MTKRAVAVRREALHSSTRRPTHHGVSAQFRDVRVSVPLGVGELNFGGQCDAHVDHNHASFTCTVARRGSSLLESDLTSLFWLSTALFVKKVPFASSSAKRTRVID